MNKEELIRKLYSDRYVNNFIKKVNLLGMKRKLDPYNTIILRAITTFIIFVIILYNYDYGYIWAPVGGCVYYILFNQLFINKKIKKRGIKLENEAMHFFENVPSIRRKMETLYDVGLSYIRLGQPSTTLSGGEAQRIKLATELSKRSTGKTIYILDEPTTGLHFADVHKLTEILHRLTEDGNTVIVIEHNLDVIKTADYIIDIGPEGGDKGGTVIAEGTPEEVAESPVSYTGKYIKPMLER